MEEEKQGPERMARMCQRPKGLRAVLGEAGGTRSCLFLLSVGY